MRCLLTVIMLGIGILSPSTLFPQEKGVRQRTTPPPIELDFNPGDPTSKIAPRYSPKGRQFTLTPSAISGIDGFDFLQTHLTLKPKSDEGPRLVLARSSAKKPYDRLYIDSNNDGEMKEPAISCEPKLTRGSWWSSFEATIMVNQAPTGQESQMLAYPIALWVVVENPESPPGMIRISRKGFLTAEVKHDEQVIQIVASDSNNDGTVEQGDWWELRTTPLSKTFGMREIGDFQWAGGRAWKLQFNADSWKKGTLVPHDPEMTEEEDAVVRDHLLADRKAVRAATPVKFRKDIEAAIEDAKAAKLRTFIKFETEWCGPCKTMAELVFTAKDVADAANGITCVVVDGDVRKDLAEEYAVKGYPTGILFDSDGKEIARYVGYQSVKQTAAFFQQSVDK